MSALHEHLREWLDDGAAPAEHGARRKPPKLWRARLRGAWRLPGRYAALAVGSALLLVAAVTGVSAAPMRGQPLAGVAAALSSALGLCIIILAALPRTPRIFLGIGERYARWVWAQVAALLFTVALALGTASAFAGGALFMLGRSPAQSYITDIISFGEVNARLVLAGQNPYTSDGAFWTALRDYPRAMATPLQRGRFAGSLDYPPVSAVYQAQHEDAAQPNLPHPEFDPRTLHSYPSLSFLVYAPLLAAGIDNVLWLHVVVYFALYAWLVWLTPPGWRGWGALVAGAALTTVGGSLFTANDIFCVALILTAWRYRRTAWLSAALLGLACAFKQYAWFFAPILLAEALARRGWGDALRRGLIALAAFAAPNLPFIIASPGAWWASLWLPMESGMFQQGVGLVALSASHALPYAPSWALAALEFAALAGVTLLVWRRAPALGEAAPLLALIPLFFAGRAFASYFAFAPWLALYAVNALERRRAALRAAEFRGDQPRLAGAAPAGGRGD